MLIVIINNYFLHSPFVSFFSKDNENWDEYQIWIKLEALLFQTSEKKIFKSS